MDTLFEKSQITLELPRVLSLLGEQAVSAPAREELAALRPSTDRREVERRLEEEMSGVARRSVPLPAQAHSGKTWLEAKG